MQWHNNREVHHPLERGHPPPMDLIALRKTALLLILPCKISSAPVSCTLLSPAGAAMWPAIGTTLPCSNITLPRHPPQPQPHLHHHPLLLFPPGPKAPTLPQEHHSPTQGAFSGSVCTHHHGNALVFHLCHQRPLLCFSVVLQLYHFWLLPVLLYVSFIPPPL